MSEEQSKSKTLNVFLVLKHGWRMLKEISNVGKKTTAIVISVCSFLGGAFITWNNATIDSRIDAKLNPVVTIMNQRKVDRDLEMQEIRINMSVMATSQNRLETKIDSIQTFLLTHAR